MNNFSPRLIAWELTGSCNLKCVHCRASAVEERDASELTTQEIMNTIDNIASFSHPILILTGGEPLVREDLFEIAGYATEKGLRVVVGTNATMITPKIARRLLDSGVKRISISLDGPTAKAHDKFRGISGAFEDTLAGAKAAQEAGLDFQVNTTVTKRNVDDLQAIYDLAIKLGAVAHHIFLLVPTGRGVDLKDEEISPGEYENVLNWMYDMQKRDSTQKKAPGHGHGGLFMKATCAPHYFRVISQRSKEEGLDISGEGGGLNAMTEGCLGGKGFSFISRYGDVYPCGYLPTSAGNIRDKPFREIWEESTLFKDLRDPRKLKGKCGKCEYKVQCGGCRARAFAKHKDYLKSEPYCIYRPPGFKNKR
ncbi:MAG: heme b synthase [Candidatus Hydrothermarchaeaceae archaeon]